ncbi:sensor domain-containing diguanylate cyclase [Nisaea sp.]|uniref:sensor domain-containing diguanylate cyclase n=1 Tax=Nisaea sp. TaxID=2024842 RepID=UPI002B2737F9|nr:sensor domain-containing diguanylate cyclase [Nisaea sp.]
MIDTFDAAPSKISDLIFREIVSKTADAIIVIDQDQKLVFFNRASEKMFGYEASDVLGKQLEVLLPHRLRLSHAHHVGEFLKSSIDTKYMGNRNQTILGRRADGCDIKLGVTIVRIRDGMKVLFAAVLRDIGWRVELIDEITEIARKDPLTEITNRRRFEEIAEFEWERARCYKTSFSFLFIDIDNFKTINDRFGHDSGDYVLKEFSQILLRSIRAIDHVCRWGGEEFVAAVPDTDREGALAMAERFRRSVEAHRFSLSNGAILEVTVSIGIDHNINVVGDISRSIRNADAALYTAKQEGRNRVLVYDHTNPTKFGSPSLQNRAEE